ncbi:hypothetical protein [Nostoc cycadae]|nr:hypothetical protein [Nostoc cycadae]
MIANLQHFSSHSPTFTEIHAIISTIYEIIGYDCLDFTAGGV